MVKVIEFNDNNDGKKNVKRKKKVGHEPEMLIPIINQAKELIKKGHTVKRGNKVYSFRAYIATVPLDYFEIPYVYGNKAHSSYCPCITCLFVGRLGQGNKKKQLHYFRFGTDDEVIKSQIIHKKLYESLVNGDLNNLFNNKSLNPLTISSIWVNKLPSFFPLQLAVVDSCHTIGIGIISWYIKMLEQYSITSYNNLVFLSSVCYIPRFESSYIQNLNYKKNWKAKDYLFFAIKTAPYLMILAKFPLNFLKTFSCYIPF